MQVQLNEEQQRSLSMLMNPDGDNRAHDQVEGHEGEPMVLEVEEWSHGTFVTVNGAYLCEDGGWATSVPGRDG